MSCPGASGGLIKYKSTSNWNALEIFQKQEAKQLILIARFRIHTFNKPLMYRVAMPLQNSQINLHLKHAENGQKWANNILENGAITFSFSVLALQSSSPWHTRAHTHMTSIWNKKLNPVRLHYLYCYLAVLWEILSGSVNLHSLFLNDKTWPTFYICPFLPLLICSVENIISIRSLFFFLCVVH